MTLGAVQLFFIAVILTYLFKMELWYLAIWLLLGTMVVLGGHISGKRASGMPQAYRVTTPSIPPYSSTTRAMCVRSRISDSSSATDSVSGTNIASRM